MAGLIRSLRAKMSSAPPPDTTSTASEMYGGPNYHPWGEAPRYEDAMNSYPRRAPQTAPELTPYLGVRSRLSQVWFNRWTVLLLLILVRVILATISLNSDLESARDKAFSACTGVESMGSAMASMPFYMANGVNELTAKGVEAAVQALQQTLLLMITGVQEIVVFIVNLLTSTYVCLITLAVHGSVGVMADALKEITDFVNSAMDDIFNGAEKDLGRIQIALNNVVKRVREILPTFMAGGLPFPAIEAPSLNRLKNGVKIPDDFLKKLEAMEQSLPAFEEVKEAANDAIRIPFKILTQQVNGTLRIYEFDRSVLPVPQKEKLTFCSGNPMINNFFDNLKDLVAKANIILVGVIAALAILAMIPMGYREWHTYRTTRRHAHMMDPSRGFDPVDVVYIASRPRSSIFGLKLARLFKSDRQQALVRWAVSYVTSPPALFVLSLGFAGLLSVMCQYILLKQVERTTPELAAEIGEFANLVIDKLESASKQWAIKSNEVLSATNAELNQELSVWVHEGTDSLNDTLTAFVDKMEAGVNSFFGNTPLAFAVKDVLNCLVTIKVRGIQKGLTWAQDNAHIALPILPEDVFFRGALESISKDADVSSSFLSDGPGSIAADQITNVVMKLTRKWEDSIRQEAIISAAVVGVWVLVLLIAVVRTLVLFSGRNLPRGEGGPAPPHVLTGGRATGGVTFPNFGNSPNTPYGPPSPGEYPDEKAVQSMVSGHTVEVEDGKHRESFHPKVYYHQS